MKKLIINSTLFTLITLVLPTHCSQQPWYTDYCIITSAIDVAMGIRTMIQRPIMAINPDKFIKINQSKLKKIKSNLRQQEKEQITMLLQESKLTDKQIEKAFTILQLVHDNRKQYLSQATQLNAKHDPELAGQIDTINKQLAAKRLNSNNMHIILQEPITPNAIAENSQYIKQQYSINLDGTINLQNYSIELQPDTIRFNPLYLNDEAINTHEAEHSIQGHHCICQTIGNIAYNVNKICHNISDFDITKLHHYHTLRQIIEKEADIFPSLRNTKSASLMRSHRHNGCHKILYDKRYHHYFNLSDIDETHKMIAYLEHVKKIRRKPMPPIKEIRLRQFPSSFA